MSNQPLQFRLERSAAERLLVYKGLGVLMGIGGDQRSVQVGLRLCEGERRNLHWLEGGVAVDGGGRPRRGAVRLHVEPGPFRKGGAGGDGRGSMDGDAAADELGNTGSVPFGNAPGSWPGQQGAAVRGGMGL